MESQRAYLDQKANNVSIDMSFLKELAQPYNEPVVLKPSKANSIDNLFQLLKLKNSRYSFSQQTKQIGQEWVRKKGGDLNPLIERIKLVKQHVHNKQEQKKAECECLFYMPTLNSENQKQYVQNNFQFGVLCSVQNIMSSGREEGNLANRILKRRKQDRDFSDQRSVFDSLPSINLQIRNGKKKEQYINATKQMLELGFGAESRVQWPKKYKMATNQNFWNIIQSQLSNVLVSAQKNINISKVAIASLKLVQEEFNRELPSSHSSILFYLTNNYLGKMRGQYESQGNIGPIWGIAFMLYRANRKQDLLTFLENQEIKELLEKAEKSIDEGNPLKILGVQENNDLFHDQIVYALRGQGKCSAEALCNPNKLDIVWVFLRNVGIFPDDTNTFFDLRRKLYHSYKGPLINEQKVKNLLYLFAYGELAEIGPNDIMDQDDYLHFLIVLYHSNAFYLLSEKQVILVERTLTQELTQYIQQLLLQQRNDYIYYMAVMPEKYCADQISSIIASSQLLENIDWGYLKSKFNLNVYENIVTLTLDKYMTIHQNYLQIARKQCQLLGDQKKALDCIVEMFLKSIYSDKLDADELGKAEQFARDIIKQNIQFQYEYTCLLNFFKEYQTLLGLVQQRNEFKIYDFLRNSHFLLISDHLRQELKTTLFKLIEYSGFESYIKFVANSVKAYEITLARMKRINDLQELQSLTLSALLSLLRNEHFSNFSNTDSALNLVKILEQALQRNQYD